MRLIIDMDSDFIIEDSALRTEKREKFSFVANSDVITIMPTGKDEDNIMTKLQFKNTTFESVIINKGNITRADFSIF